jgi:hypothetical protein
MTLELEVFRSVMGAKYILLFLKFIWRQVTLHPRKARASSNPLNATRSGKCLIAQTLVGSLLKREFGDGNP